MNEMRNTVSKQELVNELLSELDYHQNGSTTYRMETTRFALQVATQLVSTKLFFDRNKTLEFVRRALNEVNEHRLLDVSKMLSVVTRDLHNKKTLPEDAKAYVESKKQNRKRLAFV
jgi:hypothetical protein